MIKKRIFELRNKFKVFNIDGYIIPKNDEFFSEYSQKDRLKLFLIFLVLQVLQLFSSEKIIYLLMTGIQSKQK